jgi:beta-glucosidase
MVFLFVVFRNVNAQTDTKMGAYITAEDLKYFNHDLDYVCEPGDFEIMIGPNSRDLGKVMLSVK